MDDIRTSVEAARGCGYRVAGGYYLVAGELSEPCPLLPMQLDRCPHCGQGVGPARGFTWVTPAVLFPAAVHGTYGHNAMCPLGIGSRNEPENDLGSGYHRTGDRAGLIWVGGVFYPTPQDFMEEAARMGVSRRIVAPPKGFVIGEHWVYLAHRKAIDLRIPGVITLFRPTAIEYVVKGDETDDEIAALKDRGISPVRVIRDIDLEATDA